MINLRARTTLAIGTLVGCAATAVVLAVSATATDAPSSGTNIAVAADGAPESSQTAASQALAAFGATTQRPAASAQQALDVLLRDTFPRASNSELAALSGQSRLLGDGLGSIDGAISAVPTTDAGFCVTTPAGAGCVEQIPETGLLPFIGGDNYTGANRAPRQILTGIAANDVTSVSIVVGGATLEAELANNAYFYQGKAGVWADSIEAHHTDGTTSIVDVSTNPNRPR